MVSGSSQWAPVGFDVGGQRFDTAEHYMMWRKAMLFGDQAMASQILAAPHPRAAKGLGGVTSEGAVSSV